MKYHLPDYIKVEPGPDGVSIVTAKISSDKVESFLSLVSEMEHVLRFFKVKTRSCEAMYKAHINRG